MPLDPNKVLDIPLVRINIVEKGSATTNRPKFAPIYEAPLLTEFWRGRGNVTVKAVTGKGPGGRGWPPEFKRRRGSLRSEEARMRSLYEKHPITKEPVFNAIFGFGRFAGEFERAVTGEWAPGAEPVEDSPQDEHEQISNEPIAEAEDEAPAEANDDTPVGALSKVQGINEELANAIISTFDISTVAELANIKAEELETISGIGGVTAKKILDSAQDLALGQE